MSYSRVISFRPDTASNWATNNPVLSQGEGAIETDTGYLKLGDGTSTYNNLPYLTPIVNTYDLSSSNQTHTFPKVQMKGQVCDVFWTNGGTYTLSFAVSNSETIGGETASTWKGEGEGHIRVISDGTNWQVVDYRDSGSNSNGNWEKYADGTMKQWGGASASVAHSTAYGSLYYGFSATGSCTLPKAFIDTSYHLKCNIQSSGVGGVRSVNIDSTSTFHFSSFNGTNATFSVGVRFLAIGKWK